MKKFGLRWRNWDSYEDIGTHEEIGNLMKKLRLWNWDLCEEIGTLFEEIRTCVKKLVPFMKKMGRSWRNWDSDEEIRTLKKKLGLWWRNWNSEEKNGTLMKTHPAVIYLSVRSRLPPPLMIIALAAGSSLCLDWYASFRVSLRFCAVVQLHLSWCIPYIYKIVREGSNLNQLPNEVIFALYSVSFVSIINFETIPWLKQR